MPTKDYFSKSNFSYFWTKLSAILNNKVDKETGKGLSTNDFTTVYKNKLDWVNVAYGSCSTAASTATKTVTVNSNTNWALQTGSFIAVTFTTSNTANSPKLDVNGTGAKGIKFNGTSVTTNNKDKGGISGKTIFYIYDGVSYVYIAQDGERNIDTIPSAYCNTDGATATKTAVLTDYVAKSDSYTFITIVDANTSQGALTLNINGAGAKPIFINGTVSSATNYNLPAGTYIIYYDGTNYYFRTDDKVPMNIAGDAATVNGKTVFENVPSGAKFTDTTYNVVSKTANGLAPQLPNETTTTKFLRQDGTWNVPPGQNYNVVSKTADGLAPQLPNETTITKFLRQDGTWAVPPGTEYDCKPAAQGGTDLSLVTTGEKYNWNSNSSIVPSAYCDTLSTTAEKVAVCDGYTLRDNASMQLIIAYSNTSVNALTLDINSTGAKPIYINGTISSATNYTLPAGVYLIKYSVHPTFYPNGAYLFNTEGKDMLYAYRAYDADTINGFTVDENVPSGAEFTDTKNTTCSIQRLSNEKLYVIGGYAQQNYVSTNSDSGVYIGTDGHLYSNGIQTVNLSGTQNLTNKTYDGLTLSSQTTGFTIAGGTTSKTLTVTKDITLDNAAAKDVDTTIAAASTSTKLPTSQAVASFVEGKGYTTNTGTVTQVSTGVGLAGGPLTTTGTIRANLKTETASTLSSAAVSSVANKQYAVGVDADNFLSVNVPWQDTLTSAVCFSGSDDGNKEAECTAYTLTPYSYIMVNVLFDNTYVPVGTATLTFKIGYEGALPIYINGAVSSSTNYTLPAGTYLVYTDGSYYYFRTDGKITGKGLLDTHGSRQQVLAGNGNWYDPITYAQDPNVIQDASHKIGTITINEDISNTIDIYQRNVILTGTSEPDPSLGSNGDVYILLDS